MTVYLASFLHFTASSKFFNSIKISAHALLYHAHVTPLASFFVRSKDKSIIREGDQSCKIAEVGVSGGGAPTLLKKKKKCEEDTTCGNMHKHLNLAAE